MAVTAHVDLCTNRSGSDNSTHQSRRHNPFLKDRTNGRQQSGRTAQHRKTKTNNTEQQDTKKAQQKQQIKGWRPMEEVAGTCKLHRRTEGGHPSLERTLTIVAAPVDVDAAAIVAGKLSEGETGGVRWGRETSDRLGPIPGHK